MSRRQPITTAFPRTQSVSLLGILSLAAALVLITPRNASAQAQPPFAESEEVSLAAFGDNGTQSPRHRYSASEEAYLFDRLGRSRRITRAGTYLSTIGFAVYTAGMLGVAASSVDYNYGAGLPVSLTAMGAGFVATWGGSAMWGAGVLNTANALNALDIPVPRGAGIAALACGSVALSDLHVGRRADPDVVESACALQLPLRGHRWGAVGGGANSARSSSARSGDRREFLRGGGCDDWQKFAVSLR
jgi:hypothetical protein